METRENIGYEAGEGRATETTRAAIPEKSEEFYYTQDPESMQHIEFKGGQGQQMSQPNIGKKKVPGTNNIKNH